MNKVDQIFKEKLESHETMASLQAWEKLNSKLDNRKSKPIYFWISGIAASILLLVIILPYSTQKSSSVYSAPGLAKNEVKSIDKPLEQKIETYSEKNTTIAKVNKTGPIASLTVVNNVPNYKVVSNNIEPIRQSIVKIEPLSINFKGNIALPEMNLIASNKPKANHLIEITYVASTVNKEEKSTLGKIWAKAVDIKNGESDFNLRRFKNKYFKTSKTSN